MLQRLYVHNFRCLENFELSLKDVSSSLLIGKNGAGKSTIASALELFQRIGRGANNVNQLISPKHLSKVAPKQPVRFEIELLIEGSVYEYVLALELSDDLNKFSVLEEKLTIAGDQVFSREASQVTLTSQDKETQFSVQENVISLSFMQGRAKEASIVSFRIWLARIIILSPVPSLMTGESRGETLEIKREGDNFGEWFSGMIGLYPAAYRDIDKYLQSVMPDFDAIENEMTGRQVKNMMISFEKNRVKKTVDFQELSDGEKCFFLCSIVLAANKHYGPLLCFWDEPDSHLSLSEVGHFILALRRSFKQRGQLLVTSHSEEAIRKFSTDNTLILERRSHLEPTLIRPLSAVDMDGDLIDNLIIGDV